MGYRRQSFAEAVLIALLEGAASAALEVGVDKQKSFRADVASRFGRNVEFMSAYNIAREFLTDIPVPCSIVMRRLSLISMRCLR